ncbi:MAG: dihydrodipicolinate synthase family protein [Ruminiclostridium sp.]|nr:dihydrodipicolinate synthase family protein [Ruminiclostridium sp.]
MKEGFYTALGTPLDESGNLIPSSFEKHITDQIEAGASGLLVMGGMGIGAYVKNREYSKVAKASTGAAKKKCPVLIGVIDNSAARIFEKIDSLKGLDIDGIVATTPFYYSVDQEELKNFFKIISDYSPFPLYLYDLPAITKVKINPSTVENLISAGSIKGIKTGDMLTAKLLMQSTEKKDDFSIIFSGSDLFDIAYKYGLKMHIDGMFSCTAPVTAKMYRCMANGNYGEAGKCYNNILRLRDTFVEVGVFGGFSYAMNLLGYEGMFYPDYSLKLKVNECEKVKECMKKCGLL